MKLALLSASELYFPKQEWSFFRKPQAYTKRPDFFLFGYAEPKTAKTWVWGNSGEEVLLQDAGIEKLPVLFLECSSELEAYGLFLLSSFRAKAPHDAEWINALHVLQNRFQQSLLDSGLPPHWGDCLVSAGLAPHLGSLSSRSRFQFLNKEELHFLFERNWDLTSFELLENWSIEVRKLFLELILKWNLTASQTKESSHYLMMLVKKLGAQSAQSVLKGNYESSEQFRSALFNTAQPELASLSKARLEKLRALKAPLRTSIFGDPSFESDTLKITHTPRSISDFELFKSWVEDPKIHQKIKELLEIYQ